jgi:hypothetical protein
MRFGRSAEASPDDMVVRIVLHLPFLSGYASLESTDRAGEAEPGPLTFDVDPAARRHDLVLQRYSDAVRAEFESSLPHRVLQMEPRPLGSGGSLIEGSPVVWDPRTLDIDIWNLGVGLVTATYCLDSPPTMDWSTLGAEVEASRHVLKDSLQGVRASAVAEVRRAVDANRLRASGFLEDADREPDPQALWTHVTFLLEAKNGAREDELDAVAKRLTCDGVARPGRSELDRIVLRIGLDSAVGYLPGDASLAASVARMVGVHTVVWAAAVDLDRRVLRLRRKPRPTALRDLEVQMDQNMVAYEHVRGIRAELESVGVHLSALDRWLWEAYAETWGLSTQLGSLDGKLGAFEHVLSHAATDITNRRARLLSTLALPFTVASVVGLVGALLDLSSKELQAPSGSNLWLVASLIAFAIALWLILASVVVRSAERTRSVR